MARNWDSLSPAYRQRLERGGITRDQYQAGASLEKARGHKATPEHPERAESNPTKYKDYLGTRNQMVNDIQRIKRDIFGQSLKWSNSNSRRNIRVDPRTGKVRTIEDLRRILEKAERIRDESELSSDEIYEEFGEVDRTAFWYH